MGVAADMLGEQGRGHTAGFGILRVVLSKGGTRHLCF